MIQQENKPKTLLGRIVMAYKQYKLDLDYVKNKSNFWMGKPYRFGFTNFLIIKHRLKYL